MIFRPTLPDAVAPRERWLTRQEAAKLLWAAWRARQTDRGGGEGPPCRQASGAVSACLALHLHTQRRGLRRGYDADCRAWLRQSRHRQIPSQGRRRGREHKRQPTIDLPPRLLAHMRRWQRLGIAKRYLVEWNGKPVRNIRKAFERARVAAGLDDKVIPHTLRDTAVSWYLRQGVSPSVVADYAGMSEQILRRVYKHHLPGAFAPIMDASKTFGRFDQNPIILAGKARTVFVPVTGEQSWKRTRSDDTACVEIAAKNRYAPYLHAGCRRFESVTAHQPSRLRRLEPIRKTALHKRFLHSEINLYRFPYQKRGRLAQR